MIDRRALLAAALAAGSAPRATARELRAKRLGVLLYNRPETWQALREGLVAPLQRLGWTEGRNLFSDWRFAHDDATRLPALARALVDAKVDVLLTRGTPATRALQQATRTIPIVTGVGDPIGSGFAASLATPGSNVTGISYAVVETTDKRIELLREMVPGLRRMLVLLGGGPEWLRADVLRVVQGVADRLGLIIDHQAADSPAALREVLARARTGGCGAALIDPRSSIAPGAAAQAAASARMPAMFDHRAYVAAGGLMSYRLDWDDQTGRIAEQLDKVLRGANPAQMPFELPTRTHLAINLSAAKSIDLNVPRALLARAEEVIE